MNTWVWTRSSSGQDPRVACSRRGPLLTSKDDVDLEKKLAIWERFYNNDRPHGAHKGKTPYEVLREKPS